MTDGFETLQQELKKAKKRIAELEARNANIIDERFENVFHASPAAMALTAADGKYVEVNPAFLESLAFSREDVIGKTAVELGLFADPEQRDILLQRMAEQGYLSNESVCVRTPTGEIREGIFSARYIQNENERLLLTVMNDITEKMQVEKELADTEEKYRNLIQSAPVGVYEVDFRSQKFTQVNDTICRALGYSREELLALSPIRILDDEGQRRFMERIQRRLRGEELEADVEYRIKTKAGEEIYALLSAHFTHDEQGNPKGAIVFASDITERKRAEEELQASEQKLKSLIESQSHYVIRSDMNGKYTYWNAKFEEEFDYLFESDGIENAFVLGAVCEHHHERVMAVVGECIANPGAVLDVEIDKPARDGGVRTTLWEFVCLTDENGEPVEIQCMGIEITERKQVSQALEKQNQLLATIFANLRDAVFVLDWEKVEIQDCNLAAEQVFGYTRAAMLGKNTSFLHVDEAALAAFREALFPAVEEKGYLSLNDFDMKRMDGSTFPADLNVMPLLDENGVQRGWLSVIRDITERKQAEENLRESEARFKKIFDKTQGIMLLIDPVDGRLVDANPAASDFYGYNKAELLTKKISEINMLPGAEVQAEMERAAREQRNHFNFRHRIANGDIRDVEVRSSPVQIDGQTLLFSIIFDVTAQKEAEAHAEANRERWQLALEGANAGTWDWWVQSGETIFNERWAEIVGYSLAELAPVSIQTWFDICHPDDLKESEEKVREHFDGKTDYYEFEARMKHKAGHWVWVLDHGKVVERDAAGLPIRMSGTHIDITQRKRAEESVRENQRNLSLALSGANAGTWTWSAKTNVAIYNERWAEITGHHLAELAPLSNATWVNLCHPEDLKKVNGIIATLKKGETEFFQTEVRMKHKNGTWVWVQDYGKVTAWDEDGNPASLSGIHLDITEQKRIAAQQREDEQNLGLALEAAEAGTWTVNLQTMEISYNARWAEMLGYTREELNPLTVEKLRTLCHPDDLKSIGFSIEELLKEDGNALQLEIRLKHNLGYWVWLLSYGKITKRDENGRPLRLSGIQIDITFQKEVAKALTEREEYFRTLYETMTQGVLYYDKNENLIDLNPAAEKILGLSKGRMLGKHSNNPNWRVIDEHGAPMPPEERPAHLALTQRKEIRNIVMGIENPQSNTFKWLNVNAIPQFRFGERRPYQVYTTLEDITERKNNEQILRIRLNLAEYAETHTIDELLQYILDETGKVFNSPLGFFHYVTENQNSLALKAWSTQTLESYCQLERVNHHDLLNKAGVWADSIRHKKALIHNDYGALPHKHGMPKGHAVLVREMVAPIVRHGKVRAVLGIGNKPSDYTAGDLALFQTLFEFAWDIIERKMGQDALEKREAMLTEAQQLGKIGHWEWQPDGGDLFVSDEFLNIMEIESKNNIIKRSEIGKKLIFGEAERLQAHEAQITAERLDLEHDFVIRLKDNSERWIHLIGKSTYAEDGTLLRRLGTVQDITEHKLASEALRFAEARYRKLFEEAPIMYLLTKDTPDGPVVTDCNSVFCATLERTREDVIGKSLYNFYTDRSILMADDMKGYKRAMQGQLDLEERELVTATGKVIATLLQAVPEYAPDGSVLGTRAMYVDITERKEAEKALREHIERLYTLNSIDQMMREQSISEQFYNNLSELIGSHTAVDAVSILLANTETEDLVLLAQKGFKTPPLQNGVIKFGKKLAGKVAQNKQAVYLNTQKNFKEIPEESRSFFAEEEFVEYVAVPMLAHEKLLGVLELFLRHELKKPTEWVSFLQTAAGQIALTMDNNLLIDDLQRSNQELLAAYDATIYGWSLAMDLRDEETEGHTQRVTQLTVDMARKMGFSEEELVHVRRGALLHDIGKLGVPDSILLKPGKLTDDEWEIMREHPQYAYEMLEPIAYLRPALDIPYCHHEKWDGTGYPRGLKGKEIPKVARIFSVIDIWDALRSDRPYRQAWSAEKTLAHIRTLSGTHLDPDVVAAFIELIETQGE